jgi:hypothetical protein
VPGSAISVEVPRFWENTSTLEMFGKSCHCTLSKVCIVAAVSRNKDVSLGRPRTKEPKVRNNDVERDLLVLPVLALGFDTLSIPFGFCTMIRKGAIARFWQFGGPECRSGGWLLFLGPSDKAVAGVSIPMLIRTHYGLFRQQKH